MLAALLLVPTVLHVCSTLDPGGSYMLVMEEGAEEEKEEERKSGEDEGKETKEYTLVCRESAVRQVHDAIVHLHAYTHRLRSVVMAVPYLPPERV